MTTTITPPIAQLTSANIKPLTAADLSTVGINSGMLGQVYGTGGAYGIGSANITWTSGTSYTHPNTISINSPSPTWSNSQTSNTVTIKGDAEFEGKITVGGKDLMELLTKIEDKLAIFKPNPEMEEKWEELRDLAKRYKELEAEIKEKQQVWDILKK